MRGWRTHLNAWSAVTSLIDVMLGISLFVFPDLRAWVLEHGALGWGVAITALALSAVIFQVKDAQLTKLRAVISEKGKEVRDRDQRISDQEEQICKLGCTVNARDKRLVLELLDGWRVGGKFHMWLIEGFSATRLPDSYCDDITDRVTKWEADPRVIEDDDLAQAFDALSWAARNMAELIMANLWHDDAGRESTPDYDYLTVPLEWKTRTPEKYYKVLAQFREARVGLVRALDDIFAQMHKLDIDQSLV